MAAQQLGRGRCPLCGDEQARVSLSKNNLAVMTCMAPACGMQLFTRGEGADEKIRDRIVTTTEPPPAPPAPAPEPTAKPAPAPKETPFRWGILGA